MSLTVTLTLVISGLNAITALLGFIVVLRQVTKRNGSKGGPPSDTS